MQLRPQLVTECAKIFQSQLCPNFEFVIFFFHCWSNQSCLSSIEVISGDNCLMKAQVLQFVVNRSPPVMTEIFVQLELGDEKKM